MLKYFLFIIGLFICFYSNSQLYVPKLFPEILMQEEDFFGPDFCPTYMTCKRGIKNISYTFMGFSKDSVKFSKTYKKCLSTFYDVAWDSPITLYYNPQGYLTSIFSSEKIGYSYITTKDSLIISGIDYRNSYALNKEGYAEKILGLSDYKMTITADSVYIQKYESGLETTIRSIFAMQDSLFVGKDIIGKNGDRSIIQRHEYDNKKRRIQTKHWMRNTHANLPDKIEKYFFNDKGMIIRKEFFSFINDSLRKVKQIYFYYDSDENLTYMVAHYLKENNNKYACFEFKYHFFSKEDSKLYHANFCHEKRLFEEPDL